MAVDSEDHGRLRGRDKREREKKIFFTKWVISNTNQNLEPNCHKGTSEAVFNLRTLIKTSQCNYSHGKANANIATPQTAHINLIIVSSLIVGLLAQKKSFRGVELEEKKQKHTQAISS